MRQKQPSEAVQKEPTKGIHFQKFPKKGDTGDRILLLVKFKALIQK